VAGLVWHPEIGDEISERKEPSKVSVLVDPQGMTPVELRSFFIWLPSVEQMVLQFEARQAIIFHMGLELSENAFLYKTVVKSSIGPIESAAQNLRSSVGLALRDLLIASHGELVN
jgi:hypothetical protein